MMMSHARETASSSPGAKKHHPTAARKHPPRPPKSQRLHNFTLPVLKWRGTRTVRSDRPDPDDFTLRSFPNICPSTDLCRPLHSSALFYVSPPSAEEPAVREIEAIREKVLAELRSSVSKMDFRVPVKSATSAGGPASDGGSEQPSSAAGPGNLREKRTVARPPDDSRRWDSPPPATENSAKSSRRRSAAAVRGGWRRKVTLALTREEIEEDLFVITGSRPARRPRKRARNIQKQLDSCFPGLCLSEVTPETYKVADFHESRRR